MKKKVPDIYLKTEDLETGQTRLHFAAFNGDVDECRRLLDEENGDSELLDRRSIRGVTPLSRAAQIVTDGAAACAQLLVEHGANVNSRTVANDVHCFTPLRYAAYFGNLSVVRLLLAAGARCSASRWRAAQLVRSHRDSDAIRALLETSARHEQRAILCYRASLRLFTALRTAPIVGDYFILLRLLDLELGTTNDNDNKDLSSLLLKLACVNRQRRIQRAESFVAAGVRNRPSFIHYLLHIETQPKFEEMYEFGDGSSHQSSPLKVVILPGNGGRDGDDPRLHNFYGWLARSLEQLHIEVVCRAMPDAYVCRASAWLPFILNEIGVDERTVLVGHSTGAVAAMRVAERARLHSLFLVGVYHTHLNDSLERQSGYFDEPWDFDRIRGNLVGGARVYGSRCDPFLPFAEQRHVAQQLHAIESMRDDRGHYIVEQCEELLNDLLEVIRECV